jgi:hypothetical protein
MREQLLAEQEAQKKAGLHVLRFGKYKGQNLRTVAEEDILYLDWLLSINLYPETRQAILLVLGSPRFKQALEDALENNKRGK